MQPLGIMGLKVPYRRLAADVLRETRDPRALAALIDRNFAEIERAWPATGTFTASTDASAYITVTHGAGFLPSVVLVQPVAPISGADIFGIAVVDSITATTFRVRCWRPGGTGIFSLSVTGNYACFR